MTTDDDKKLIPALVGGVEGSGAARLSRFDSDV
jgi:hypothetical protein